MKTISVIMLLLVLTSPVSGQTYRDEVEKEISAINCSVWNGSPEGAKSLFLFAYNLGVTLTILNLPDVDSRAKERARSAVWPKGYTQGAVEMALDIFCRRPENYSTFLGRAIRIVAEEAVR